MNLLRAMNNSDESCRAGATSFNDSYAERVPLSVGISGDEGNTLQVRDIEVKNGIYGYPKLLQTRDGLWHLFYSQNYHHIEHVSFDEDWLLSGRRVIGA